VSPSCGNNMCTTLGLVDFLAVLASNKADMWIKGSRLMFVPPANTRKSHHPHLVYRFDYPARNTHSATTDDSRVAAGILFPYRMRHHF
jgi:hypothetical protein